MASDDRRGLMAVVCGPSPRHDTTGRRRIYAPPKGVLLGGFQRPAVDESGRALGWRVWPIDPQTWAVPEGPQFSPDGQFRSPLAALAADEAVSSFTSTLYEWRRVTRSRVDFRCARCDAAVVFHWPHAGVVALLDRALAAGVSYITLSELAATVSSTDE